MGIMVTIIGALLIIFFIRDPFQGLMWKAHGNWWQDRS
jgi:hypothetical protein